MPIIESEIKYFQSTNKLGGPITGTEVISGTLHDIFDIVDSDESNDGHIDYRCIYIKNENLSLVFENVISYIISNTPSADTVFALGIGTSPAGSSEQAIPDEITPPIGVVFTELDGIDEALTVGNIPAGSYKALWFRRTVNANTTAATADGAVIRCEGDTAK